MPNPADSASTDHWWSASDVAFESHLPEVPGADPREGPALPPSLQAHLDCVRRVVDIASVRQCDLLEQILENQEHLLSEIAPLQKLEGDAPAQADLSGHAGAQSECESRLKMPLLPQPQSDTFDMWRAPPAIKSNSGSDTELGNGTPAKFDTSKTEITASLNTASTSPTVVPHSLSPSIATHHLTRGASDWLGRKRPAVPFKGTPLATPVPATEMGHQISKKSAGAMERLRRRLQPQRPRPVPEATPDTSQKTETTGSSDKASNGATEKSSGFSRVLPAAGHLASQLTLAKGWIEQMHYEPINQQAIREMRASRGCVFRVVHSLSFDVVCTLAIILNAVVLSLSVNDVATTGDTIHGDLYKNMNLALNSYFVFEICMRVLADGLRFWVGPDCKWNIFDVAVIVATCVDLSHEWHANSTGATANLSVIRIMRVVRLVRVVRIIRVIRFFSELRMMVASTMGSMKSLNWACLLLALIIFMFSVPLVQNVSVFRLETAPGLDPELDMQLTRFYGGVMICMLTLFQVISGGVSWIECSEPLMVISPYWAIYLCIYVAFTVFAVLNIVTGIFVGTAIQSAQTDRENVIQEEINNTDSYARELLKLFEEADSDNSGYIDLDEFERHLDDPRIKAYFRFLGLQVGEAWGLFRLLDMDDSGYVEIHEFVTGCLRLKGTAKSVDVATLLYENKRMMVMFQKWMRKIDGHLKPMSAKLQALPVARRVPGRRVADATSKEGKAGGEEGEKLTRRHVSFRQDMSEREPVSEKTDPGMPSGTTEEDRALEPLRQQPAQPRWDMPGLTRRDGDLTSAMAALPAARREQAMMIAIAAT